MEDCVFCRIANGSGSAYRVYEDDKFVSFLDNRPLTKGNCLVIPREHHERVDDVADFGEYFEVARKVGKANQRAFSSSWTQYLTIGHEVPHAHIRVIPRYTQDLHGAVPDLAKIERFSEEEMGEIANKIKKEIIIDH